MVDLGSIRDAQPHPLVEGSETSDCCAIWAEEVGKLLILHDQLCEKDGFFVGITSDSAFAGGEIGSYKSPSENRHFPLIGPENLHFLQDAVTWEVPCDIHSKSVSFAEAKANFPILGGEVQAKTNSGSHWKVTFSGAPRPYSLDRNDDPQPDDYLREIVHLIGKPLGVIKYALIYGELPPSKNRLESYLR